jgi:hypothetical protein
MAGISVMYANTLLPRSEEKISNTTFIALAKRERVGIAKYILSTLLFTFFMNIDVLFAKIIFEPERAGVYA